MRSIVANLNRTKQAPWPLTEPEPPKYDAEELYGVVPADPRRSFDVRASHYEVVLREAPS